jgi:hypothetical protein
MAKEPNLQGREDLAGLAYLEAPNRKQENKKHER